MSVVAIVDYGMCNLDSMARAVEENGGRPLVTSDPADLKDATHIILPGVGSFAEAMKNLSERELDQALTEQALNRGIPFLGVCLGMQLLATVGFEGGETAGLGWIRGEVRRLTPAKGDLRIPHIGWNEVFPDKEDALFADITPGTDFYFVHSYHCCCYDPNDIAASTPYADGFTSAISHENIRGVQFHPEKSQRPGFQVLKNFLSM